MSNYKLSELQESSLEQLRNMKSAIVALSPGCGKSLLVLHHVKNDLLKDNNDKCIFFIPKSARAAFEKEMRTKLCEDYILICAGKQFTYKDLENNRFIFIENTLVNKYIEDLISIAGKYSCHLVIDEAHSLQSQDSVFAKAAWEVRCYCKKIIAMTATPLLNSIDGLFNLYHFTYPAVFTSWFRFRSRYCITQDRVIRMKNRQGKLIERKVTDIVGYQNMEELNSILDKLTIKGCVHYNVNFEFIECPLDVECEKLYKFASNGLYDILYKPDKAQARLAKKNTNVKQKETNISDNAKDFGARLHDIQRVVDFGDGQLDTNFVSNKMKTMCQKVFEIMQRNESTLIYFEYIDSLEVAEKLLLENKQMLGFKNIYRLTGAEKEDYRVKVENNLSAREIILCSQAASQSRNLQKANNIICFHLPWSCGRLVQVCGRICRTDTTYDTQNIYFTVVSNTIDEYKLELFKKRLSLIKALLGDESTGTLDSCDCSYVDVDYSDVKELKNHLLWKRK